MRLKLGATLLAIMCYASIFAQSPTKAGFQKLTNIYAEATALLNDVKDTTDLADALRGLNSLKERFADDIDMQLALQTTPETCPDTLTAYYGEALKCQADMKDAGKRLAMGGIMSRGANAVAYSEFIKTFALVDNLSNETITEGAPYETKEDRDIRMQWWRDAKFAMFIHYGLFSALAGEVQGEEYEGCVEWIQMISGLDSETYAKEALPKFNPKSGNAEKWVKLAKESGCKYVVLTTRHHEGFNMWSTEATDFNAVKQTGVDVVKEYSEACDKYDIKAGYYFSLIDWSHPDYDPTGSGISYPEGNYEAEREGRREFGNHQKYKDYLYSIFCDLTENYKVDLVWWDFSQPNFQGDKAWGATRIMKRLFDKHPNAIQNNRLYHSDNHVSEGGIKVTPHQKGDYSTAEQHVPATGIDGDWEACQTLNGTWGYSATNQNWKRSEDLIKELIDAVSRGGNYLLNIGPMSDGEIPQQSVAIFKEIGEWMNINSDAIYGTRANPFDVELDWGRVTRKGDDTIYIFVYDTPEDGVLQLPCTYGKARAKVLGSGEKIKVKRDKLKGVTLFDISELQLHKGATVIEVTGSYNVTLGN